MFYIIDKEVGMSSFDIIRRLRKETGIRKMGHTGTLDPFASGLMIIASGNSTKLIPLLEGSYKEYICTIHLDGRSETLDTEGTILPVDVSGYIDRTNAEILSFLLSLTSQTPPRYSAIHIHGARAYDLARSGKEFTPPTRPIHISDCEILQHEKYHIKIRVVISSGGYIRSLAPDLGKLFGVDGGYVSSLRRTRIFTKYRTFDIDDSSSILGIEDTFYTIRTYIVGDEVIERLINGQSISYSFSEFGDTHMGDYLFLRNHDGTFVSLCLKNKGTLDIVKNNIGDL